MNSSKRVMLLIDADNVSADVIEQAVGKVMVEHGAIHVRRAYCTAESALANLKLFTAHAIRPIVNLSTGKNSTDIALAVDAVDLVLAERPDVVVIVSSDSDFAPLVIKLREKGCRVEGIGQLGKTGVDSKPVYDGFTDIAHRKSGRGEASQRALPPARKRAPAGPRQAEVAVAPPAVSTPPPLPQMSLPLAAEPAPEPVQRRTPRTRANRQPAPPVAPVAAPMATPAPEAVAARAPLPDDLRRILAVLPELARGGAMELGIAAERLRSEDLLAKNAPSTKLFRKFPDWFLLTPEQQPNKVQYRGLPRG